MQLAEHRMAHKFVSPVDKLIQSEKIYAENKGNDPTCSDFAN
jgi:hypothetical protein